MLAARMHGYKQPLVLEEVKIPEISSDQVLVRVGGAGMCRSDVQLIDGYFQEAIKPKFPRQQDRYSFVSICSRRIYLSRFFLGQLQRFAGSAGTSTTRQDSAFHKAHPV